MAKSFPFGDTLARMRREQGFASPHAFYKGSGGAQVLGLSFPKYLLLERGRSLPKPWRFKAIVKALGLAPGTQEHSELVRAYLVSMLGDAELIESLGSARAPLGSLDAEAARMAIRQRAVNMDLDQWRASAEDAHTFLVDHYLTNTPGFVELSKVAKAIGLHESKVQGAVKRLAAARIVEVSGKRARSRFAYKLVKPLPMTPATAGIQAAIEKHWEGMLGAGKLLHKSRLTVRMPKGNVPRYIQQLQQAVDVASAYGDVEADPDTEVYAINAGLFKLFD